MQPILPIIKPCLYIALLFIFNLALNNKLVAQNNEIKDCNGNNITVQTIMVRSSTGANLITTNCTFSNGALSTYLNCIRANNPLLPQSSNLIVNLAADATSGITAIDLELLKQEVLQKNFIANTCNRVGSDSDINNKLNTIDLCLIRKHNLGLSNINPVWKFYKSQNISLTGIGDTTDLVFPISDFPLSTLNIIGVHNGNVNQVSLSNDTCVLLCQPSLEIIAGTDIVRKPTPEYFLLNKSCSFQNLSLQISNELGQIIENEITQNMVGNEFTAQLNIANTAQSCTTKLTVYPCETFVNIDVDQINTTDSTFVDISVRNAEFIAGYQLSFKFDTTLLQFVKIEKGNDTGFNASNDANYNGKEHVNISRFKESSSLGLEEGSRLFRLKFKRKSSTVHNVTIDPENVETLLFDTNKNEYCPDITYLQDTNPPLCLQDTIMLQGDQALGYATIKFSDYGSDDFGTVSFESGVNELDFPITNVDTFNCGTNILTYVIFKDANGQSKECVFRVIVECPNDTCTNKFLYFDGVNDRINIPNQHTGNVEFTIECWFKSDNVVNGGTGEYHRIFTLGSSNRLEIGDQLGRIIVYNNGVGTVHGPNIRDDLWHHLTFIRDANKLKVYLDGIPLTVSLNSPIVDIQSVRIGYFNNSAITPGTMWKGGIDEIKLWNYPLSQEEINNSKNKISTIKKDCGLIGYWRMEEGIPEGNNQAITEIRDSVGTNHGTLVGFNLQGDQSNFLCNDSLSLILDNEPCCQSFFSYSTNCNRINLSGNTEGFTNLSSITYNWTSTNTNFKSSSKDTIFNYFGDLPEVIICLEATDGLCSAIFCDTIPVTLPISPVFTGCPVSISLTSGESCSLSFPFNIPIATDPCTGMQAMVGCKRSDGMPLSASFPLGVTTINCTASSVLGNEFDATCEFDIEILDETKPICIPKNAEIYLDNIGLTTFPPQLIDGGSTDNCGEITLRILGQQTFTCADIGNQIKTLIVTDESNNTSTCQGTIIVLDSLSPICNGIKLNRNIGDNGSVNILASELNNNSTDNCGNITFTASKTIFNCTDVLTTNLVTLTVTDQSGNSSSCPVEVTILDPNEFCACLTDETDPICKTKNIILDLDLTGNAIITPELINDGSFDACSDITLQIEVASAFDCNSLGSQLVNLVVTDQANNGSFCPATVTVQDKQLPNCILIPTLFHLDQTGNIIVTKDNLDISVSDNCSEVTTIFDALNFNCLDTGPQNIIVSVLDASGNINVCSTLITITDTIRPTCSIESKTFYLSSDGQVNINQDQLIITSNDNCAGVTTAFNSINYNCNDLGVKNISATVLDVNGNTNICSVQITVSDSIRPTCSIPDRTIFIDTNGQSSLSQAQLNITANDNCAGVTTTFNTVNYNCNDIGTKNIMATVRDVAGNTNACTAQITIRDTIRPICFIRDTIVTSTDGNGAIVIFNGRATDNCAEGLTISYSQPADQFYPCGEYNIIMSARDGSGNTSTCPFKLTVKDCDGCCLSESSFMTNTDVDFNLSSDLLNADSCIIKFITPKLTECQTVTEISWGDGTVSRGSFTNAVDFTHQYTEPAIYEVCVTYEEANQQNCFKNKKCNSFEVIDNCTLKRSSGQFDYNKIILVPNPTNRNFAISGGEIFTDYAIYDQLGREMVAKRKVESTNDISQLQNGVYFVRLTVGSINVTKRIIKIQ